MDVYCPLCRYLCLKHYDNLYECKSKKCKIKYIKFKIYDFENILDESKNKKSHTSKNRGCCKKYIAEVLK